MPIALNPKKRYWISLKSDADTSLEVRPAFQFRQLTTSQALDLCDLFDGRDKPETGKQYLQACLGILCDCMTGWKNMVADEDWPGPEKPGEPLKFDRSDREAFK